MNEDLIKIFNGIPYHKYDASSEYLFHPMRAGRWLYNNASVENYQNFMKISEIGDNDSILWYYSDKYKLARMLNKKVTSCISQAEFLSAFCKLYKKRLIPLKEVERVFNSFKISELIYKDALIELPLPYNHPEIILNGWLHAISRIIDYYKITKQNDDLLEKTIFRLSQMIHIFDDPERKLSKYSDLTVYKLKIFNVNNAKIKYTKDHIFDLTYNPKFSLYDCSLERDMGKYHFANIGITNNVHHRIINDEPFKIEITEGKYLPSNTIPTTGGNLITVNSTPFGSKHSLIIPTEKLIKGYPTPFSKNGGTNYYHTYHVVALKDIVKSYPTEHNKLFSEYADLWESYIDNRNFTSIETMTKDFVKGKLIV